MLIAHKASTSYVTAVVNTSSAESELGDICIMVAYKAMQISTTRKGPHYIPPVVDARNP